METFLERKFTKAFEQKIELICLHLDLFNLKFCSKAFQKSTNTLAFGTFSLKVLGQHFAQQSIAHYV